MLANGDIQSLEDARRCITYTGANGVMSADPLLANPALFRCPSRMRAPHNPRPPSPHTLRTHAGIGTGSCRICLALTATGRMARVICRCGTLVSCTQLSCVQES